MANITISVPDALVPRVLAAVKTDQGWTADSGVTEAELIKTTLRSYLKAIVLRVEGQQAAVAACEAADSDIVLG